MKVIYSSDLIKEIENSHFQKGSQIILRKAYLELFLTMEQEQIFLFKEKYIFQTILMVNPDIAIYIYNIYAHLVLFQKTI